MAVAAILTMLGTERVADFTSNVKWMTQRKLICTLYVINIIAIWACMLVIMLPL